MSEVTPRLADCSSANATPLVCEVYGEKYLKSNDRLVCAIALFRHADRTCKQKVSLKFAGDPPSQFSVNEDIRAASLFRELAKYVRERRTECKSEESVYMNGLGILQSEKEDLKVKIERLPTGWLLKLKWGGSLTSVGVAQSVAAGREFRQLLGSEAASDLKVYSSTDTRCQETAAAFVKGLVDEPESVRIRAEDGPDGLGSLDETGFRHSSIVGRMRSEISSLLMSGRRIDKEFEADLFPDKSEAWAAKAALTQIASKYRSFADAVLDLREKLDSFVAAISKLDKSLSANSSESLGLMANRWLAIWKSLHRMDRTGNSSTTVSGAPFSSVQISLIGEIFDNAHFDLRHSLANLKSINAKAATQLATLSDLVTLLSRVVTPAEYGLSTVDKSYIGSTFLQPLIRKLRFDFRLSAGIPLGEEAMYLTKHDDSDAVQNSARTRLYFAHHSHMMSFVNVLKSESLLTEEFSRDVAWLHQIDHLSYLSRIVLCVYRTELGRWRLTVQVGTGDKSALHTVVDGTTESVESIDEFFNAMLLLPIRRKAADDKFQSILTIAESSETLFQED